MKLNKQSKELIDKVIDEDFIMFMQSDYYRAIQEIIVYGNIFEDNVDKND